MNSCQEVGLSILFLLFSFIVVDLINRTGILMGIEIPFFVLGVGLIVVALKKVVQGD